MLRFLNIAAIAALVGSAVYAYSIKYQTSYRAEQIAKTNLEITAERDAIAVLRAEWAYMTRPERLQPIADKYLADLKPLQVTQLVPAQSLPQRAGRIDSIGAKLSEIGASLPATPPAAPGATTTTPKTEAAKTKSATPRTATKTQAAAPQSPREPRKP
jgi:cell division protein FtsL